MEWRCRECDRTYDTPPESCACGSSNVGPDDGARRDRYSLLALRRRLLDPSGADRSLVRREPYVAWAFRVLVAVAGLVAVLLALLLLV